jgi:hypothetical protein
MSRAATPQQGQPMQPQQGQVKVPHEKIAQRAYEKWLKRGQPTGSSDQDWFDAEKELIQEMRSQGQTQSPQRR